MKARSDNLLALMGRYTVLTAVAIVMIFPFVWMMSSSLKSLVGLSQYPPVLFPRHLQFSNYLAVLSKPLIWIYLKNTLLLIIGNTLGTLISSSLVAYPLARMEFRGKNFIFSLIIATMMVPTICMIIPQYLLFSKFGWLDSLKPMIVPAFFAYPYNVFLLRQFFKSIPKSIDEAAIIDGCNHFDIYFRILVPLAKSAFITIGVLSSVFWWNELFQPLIYINSEDMKPLTVGALTTFKMAGSFVTQWNITMAMTTLYGSAADRTISARAKIYSRRHQDFRYERLGGSTHMSGRYERVKLTDSKVTGGFGVSESRSSPMRSFPINGRAQRQHPRSGAEPCGRELQNRCRRILREFQRPRFPGQRCREMDGGGELFARIVPECRARENARFPCDAHGQGAAAGWVSQYLFYRRDARSPLDGFFLRTRALLCRTSHRGRGGLPSRHGKDRLPRGNAQVRRLYRQRHRSGGGEEACILRPPRDRVGSLQALQRDGSADTFPSPSISSTSGDDNPPF